MNLDIHVQVNSKFYLPTSNGCRVQLKETTFVEKTRVIIHLCCSNYDVSHSTQSLDFVENIHLNKDRCSKICDILRFILVKISDSIKMGRSGKHLYLNIPDIEPTYFKI